MTEEIYKDVFATHLRNEVCLDRVRRENKETLNMHQAFESVDLNQNGFIDHADVSILTKFF